MLYELFYYSKKADRDAFEHLGYKIKGGNYDDEDDYDEEDDFDDNDFIVKNPKSFDDDEEDEDKV
jgi:hypothetical protein